MWRRRRSVSWGGAGAKRSSENERSVKQRLCPVYAPDGNSAAVADRMASFTDRETAVDTAAWLELDRRYST